MNGHTTEACDNWVRTKTYRKANEIEPLTSKSRCNRVDQCADFKTCQLENETSELVLQ